MVCLSEQEESLSVSADFRTQKHTQRLLTTWLFNCRCDDCSKSQETEDEACDFSGILDSKSVDASIHQGQESQDTRCTVLSQIKCKDNDIIGKVELPAIAKVMYPCITSLPQLVSMLSERIQELSGPSALSFLLFHVLSRHEPSEMTRRLSFRSATARAEGGPDHPQPPRPLRRGPARVRQVRALRAQQALHAQPRGLLAQLRPAHALLEPGQAEPGPRPQRLALPHEGPRGARPLPAPAVLPSPE